jgi:hypothetical protein
MHFTILAVGVRQETRIISRIPANRVAYLFTGFEVVTFRSDACKKL